MKKIHAVTAALLGRGRNRLMTTPLTISAPILQLNASLDDCHGDVDLPRKQLRRSFDPAFQFMSDLHLEHGHRYADFTISPCAPYLILAGDIGQLWHESEYLSFLRRHCDMFQRVFLIPGNHEFYGISRPEGLRVLDQMQQELDGRLFVMNRTRCNIDGTILLGCTLHSHIPSEVEGLTNDFQRITNWHVSDHNREHCLDRAWLEQTLEDIHATLPLSRVIIATHYAPSYENTAHPRHESSKYKHCFCSDTLSEISANQAVPQLETWVFGHTHYNAYFYFGKTLVVSNQVDDRLCARKFDLEATI